MMRQTAIAILLAGFGPTFFPFTASAQFRLLETEDLRLLYVEATQSYLAPYAARCFENSLSFHRSLFDYAPSDKVGMLLIDLSDTGNAAAGAVPRNTLAVQISPLSFAYETISANERMNWLMNHELVHIVTQDQAARSERRFRRLFQGKVAQNAEQPETILYWYLTAPRRAAPRWYSEGMAVFIETWMAGGIGRAQGPWDEMVFRSMVRDESRFYDPLGLVSEGTKIDFQVEVNSYLYGTRFMSYLAYQHDPEDLIRWASRTDGGRKYYASEFRQVFGRPIRDEWHDWIEWEYDFQQQNLDAIREYPVTPSQDLSDRALGSVSRAYYDADRRQLYAAFNYPGVLAHVGAISVDDGSIEKIVNVKDPVIYEVTSLAYDPDEKIIYYTTDNHEYRDLRAVDPEGGKPRVLLKDARIGSLAFNRADRSIWGIRHFNGIASLVRIPHPYTEWNRIHSWPYGEMMYDLDISPDGRLLSASVGEINGRQSLRIWETEDLLTGDLTPIARLETGDSIPLNFVFSPDGSCLYGSSYYTGVSNIFRYEWQTDDLQAVSNSDTGLFRPIPLEDGSLIVFRYTGKGFVPATIQPTPLEDVNPITYLGQQVAAKHPVVKDWMIGSPDEVALDDLIVQEDDYHGFKSISLESLYPVVQGYKDSAAIGMRVNFSDPMMINRVSLTASYSPDNALPSDERAHAHVKFERHDWQVDLRYNYADFYDLFGPTKTSLKGYSAAIGWDRTLLYDRPREMELNLDVAFFGGLDQVPGYQNVASPYEELFWTQIRLGYSNVRSSLGHVDDEKGYAWEIVAANNYVNSQSIPNVYGILDFGVALPIRHSSIWLRTSAGYAHGDKDDPFANFYFGGFGNNYVDHRTEKRYREFYSFPGVELNEIEGQTYTKAMLEWNLPPLRFESAGWPGFYLSWARTALFTTGIVTDPDSSDLRTEVANIGVQIDLRFTVLSRLDMTVSLGYATAFEKGSSDSDEYMISLKIL